MKVSTKKLRNLIILAFAFAAVPAWAQVAQRDRLGSRFDNDIRSNNEALSRRFSGPNDRIETDNRRIRERLNTSKTGGLRRP